MPGRPARSENVHVVAQRHALASATDECGFAQHIPPAQTGHAQRKIDQRGVPRGIAGGIQPAGLPPRGAAQEDRVIHRRRQLGMMRRQRRRGAREPMRLVGQRRQFAHARPRCGLAGVAPRRGGGDGGIARGAGHELGRPAGTRHRVAGEHQYVRVPAGFEHAVEMRSLADAARAAGVIGLQRSAREPAFDDGETARPGLGIVRQPHAGIARSAGVERGETGVEGVVIDAHRNQYDGQFAHGEKSPAINGAAARAWVWPCSAATAGPWPGTGANTRR